MMMVVYSEKVIIYQPSSSCQSSWGTYFTACGKTR